MNEEKTKTSFRKKPFGKFLFYFFIPAFLVFISHIIVGEIEAAAYNKRVEQGIEQTFNNLSNNSYDYESKQLSIYNKIEAETEAWYKKNRIIIFARDYYIMHISILIIYFLLFLKFRK